MRGLRQPSFLRTVVLAGLVGLGGASLLADAPAEPADSSSPEVAIGPRYVDKTGGFSLCIPQNWRCKTFTDGKPWVFDATDVTSSLLSVGFSPFPAGLEADQMDVNKVAAFMAQNRTNFVVHAAGRAEVAGRRAVWVKFTGDIPMTTGPLRMTAVQYLVPLGDNRALELRVAAFPDKFDAASDRLKQCVASFRLEKP